LAVNCITLITQVDCVHFKWYTHHIKTTYLPLLPRTFNTQKVHAATNAFFQYRLFVYNFVSRLFLVCSRVYSINVAPLTTTRDIQAYEK